MPRLQKRIAIFLVLFLVVTTSLCLVDFGRGNSGVNKLASLAGLKAVVSEPVVEPGRLGLSIISKENVRPNIGGLLVYAFLGFIIASTIYGLQRRIGGLSSSDWMELGRRMTESAYYEEAIDAYSIATQLNPRGAIAFAERGVAYHKLGDYERAVQDYHTALRLKPTLTTYYRELSDYFNSLKLAAGHLGHEEGHGSYQLSKTSFFKREDLRTADFLWCPNCYVAMKIARGSRGCFKCPKCNHEFFA